VQRGPAAGLAALAAYEVQATDVAASKAEGLRRHYGTAGDGCRFWDVHAAIESSHADWTQMALSDMSVSEMEVVDAATSAAQAWWEFLTDRESERELLTR
jgi:pyrroloquinoline quinone (PQQ) biosynthesis protein C